MRRRLTCPACGDESPSGMICPTCETVTVHAGLTRAELWRAFELVRPMNNWKGRIRRQISARQMNLHGATCYSVTEAVRFYTASEPTWKADGRDVWVVTADGYHATVGA